MSIQLPTVLTAALPRFDQAAQHVEQYFALRSVYRKSEALNRAVSEVEALQRRLIVIQGRAALRLLQVANEWRRLSEAEHETLQAQTNLVT